MEVVRVGRRARRFFLVVLDFEIAKAAKGAVRGSKGEGKTARGSC